MAQEWPKDDLRTRVRELHGWHESCGNLECDGCDFESNWEGAPPQWPCRTAEMVYSPDEIAETLAAWESYRKWQRDHENRERLATGWGWGDELNRMTQRMVRNMLDGEQRFRALLSRVPSEGTVTFEIDRG